MKFYETALTLFVLDWRTRWCGRHLATCLQIYNTIQIAFNT